MEEFAAREAAGESVWTDGFDPRAVVRVSELWRLVENELGGYHESMPATVGQILRAWAGWQVSYFNAEDLPRLTETTSILDAIAAAHEAANQMDPHGDTAATFADIVNKILNEHRIAHKFVDGELVPFKSDELMHEVVEPTLRLLVGSKFKEAHDSYLKALKEISNNDPGDAITNAGTALQATLTALGCEGDVLSTLLKDAKAKGLFKQHDQQLHESVILMAKWATSERNKNSNAHRHSDATLADAWLMVHVIGALIVRLVDPDWRGGVQA